MTKEDKTMGESNIFVGKIHLNQQPVHIIYYLSTYLVSFIIDKIKHFVNKYLFTIYTNRKLGMMKILTKIWYILLSL